MVNQYSITASIDISIIEILLMSIIAFIGAFIHEYISFIRRGKRITIMVWLNIFVTVIIDLIISISINPFVAKIHPRLVLLPPLLIGLLGTELAIRLSTIGGSTSLIEYILGFLKIKRADTTQTPKDNVPTVDDSLDDEIVKISAKMELLLGEYYREKNEELFLSVYKSLKEDSINMKNEIKKRLESEELIPLPIALKLSEMFKIEIVLDKVYDEIITKDKG